MAAEQGFDSDPGIEDFIINNYVILSKRLEVESVIPHLIQYRILTFNDRSRILQKDTQTAQAEELLGILCHNGKCTANQLRVVLGQTKQTALLASLNVNPGEKLKWECLPTKVQLEYIKRRHDKLDKSLKKADKLFTSKTPKDKKRIKKVKKEMTRCKAVIKSIIPKGCFVINLIFLQPSDVDDFYHDHFRVGPGTLSAALSNLLITDEMRAAVGGEELMVRVEVRYDDYIRVRRRLCTTGLQRSTSVDNLSVTLPPPEKTASHPLLNSLDLAATITVEDSSFTDWVIDLYTKQLQLRIRQKSRQLTTLEAKHGIAKHQIELQKVMVQSHQKEVTRLTQEMETAQKVLLDDKKEIKDLKEVDKAREETNKELIAEKTKLTNRLDMLEDKVESLEKEVTRLTQEKETAQKVLLDHKKEIEDLTRGNKAMRDRIEELLAEKTKLSNKLAIRKHPVYVHQEEHERERMPTLGISPPHIFIRYMLLNAEHYTSGGGISTINCEMARELSAASFRAAVCCTVLRATREDVKSAKKDSVRLIEPFQEVGNESEPSLDWLTFDHRHRYPDLPDGITCIVGHADITDKAARRIKDDRYPQADLITVNHVIPEDTEYYKGGRKPMKAREKEQDILKMSDGAKAAFSVGPRIFNHFCTMYKGDKKPRNHYLYLPQPPEMFVKAKVKPPGDGERSVLSVGRVRKVERLKGHDMAAWAMGKVAERIKGVRWCVRGISEDDHETSKKILEDNLRSGILKPTLLPYGTQEEIRDDMMTAHLVLMPSRSEPFGLVGLEAIAAGIPVLISSQSGLADLITDLIEKKKLHADRRLRIVETSVNESDLDADAERWAAKILDTLENIEAEFEKAAEFKRELMASEYWVESHQAFLQACGITADPARH